MIREYRATDLDELLDAWYSASKVGHPFLDETFLAREREDIISLYIPKTDTWVYELDGKVVGFISVFDNDVGGLFVHADYHRRGIGHKLMDHASKLKQPLSLDVFEDNSIGRNFYKKYGFTEIGIAFDEETQKNQIRMKLFE